MRRQLDAVTVAAHRSEQAAHLGERCAACFFDAAESVLVLVPGARELVAYRADLEHHHADGMRDDVVQFACDARSLLRNRNPSGGLSFPLGKHRSHLRCLALMLGQAGPHLGGLGLL